MEDFRFDGVHLRLEADASRWIVANGGLSETWESYLEACMVRVVAIEYNSCARE